MKQMHLRSSLFLAAVLLLGSAYKVNAQNDTTASESRAADAPMSAASFISKNVRDNKMEVEMAQMALEKSQNANVKSVAEVLVRDHSDLLQQLTSLNGGANPEMENSGTENNDNYNNQADTAGTTRSMPGDTGTASNQLDIAGTKTTKDLDTAGGNHAMGTDTSDMHSMLANVSGEEFDSLWINQMLTKHKLKLGELHNARNNISDPQIKTLVRNAIPIIRGHRDMLTSLKNNPDRPVKMKGQGRDGRSKKESGNRRNRNNAGDTTNQ